MTLLYQTDIIKTIEELSPLCDLEYNLKYLVKSVVKYFKLSTEINYRYIIGLLENDDNKIVYYNLNPTLTFNINECSSAIIYNVAHINNNFICYILLLTTIPQHRNKGYAAKLLKEFSDDMKDKYNNIKFI